MKQKTILFVDNTANYLDVHARLLEEAGYRVYRAYSLAQAEEKLAIQHVHLIILDIRLEDDDDVEDISGLLLARQELYRPIPKIILTAYPSIEMAREALGPRLDSLPPAVNFILKDEGIDAILKAVERGFNEYVRLNWQLDIRRDHHHSLSLAHLATLIEPELAHELLPARIDELEDLFCRLFYNSRQINLHRLMAVGHHTVSVAVFSFFPDGLPFRLVVSCGLRQAIQNEDERFEKYAPRIATEGATAKLTQQRIETTHYAAVAYILTDAELETVVPLAEFYRHNCPEAIVAVLTHLFGRALARYHQQYLKIEETDSLVAALAPYFFADEAVLTQPALTARISALQAHALLNNLPRFDNTALKLLTNLLEGEMPLDASIQYGLTHQRLGGDTILADPRRRAWVIDFGGLNQGPLVQDWVDVEILVKFTLTGDLSHQERRQLEEYLQFKPDDSDLSPDLTDVSDEIKKAATVIQAIRQYAFQKMNLSRPLYQIGLLLRTLDVLNRYNPEIYYRSSELARYLHALDSARKICHSFSPDPPQYDKSHSPWLDQDKLGYDVWLEGQWLTLAETEYKLLTVLYCRAIDYPRDSICTFAVIGKGVWGDYDRLRDYNNIQSLVRRVRDRLQPDGDASYQYIENIRGMGYRLNLRHHAAAD